MTEQEQSVEEELREFTEALQEHLLWQKRCGATGLPRAIAVQEPDQDLAPTASPEPVDRERVVAPVAEAATATRAPESTPPLEPKQPQFAVPADAEARLARLAELKLATSDCKKCSLHLKRTQAVFSRGTPTTELMFVGEGPGAEEDAQGEPFVGKAGQLLDKMIVAMGYDRDRIYIANVVKCRPPDNRTPEPEEMAACLPYLQEQIALVSPKVIVALGATALKGLLGTTEGITRLRGKWKLYRATIPVMPTFHPAYLLRKEEAKRDVWSDLKEVVKMLGKTVPERKR